jgi:D-alanine transaminase
MISPRNLTVSKRVNGVESVVDNMTEWIWLNGEIMPMADARLGIEDRGFQFADGVYEVIRLYDGKPFALATHLERLWKSAVEMRWSISS